MENMEKIELKAILVKKKIEKDFKDTNEQELENFFDKFEKESIRTIFV